MKTHPKQKKVTQEGYATLWKHTGSATGFYTNVASAEREKDESELNLEIVPCTITYSLPQKTTKRITNE